MPRWQWIEGRRIEVEPGFPLHVAEQLSRRGHEVSYQMDASRFGRAR